LAASCAAAIRLGDTSVAFIDCDTSITSITTARLRGILTSWVGPAIAMVNSTSDTISRIVARCRHRDGRLGATLSNSSEFANRCSRLRRDRCMPRYSRTSPATTSRNRKYQTWSKPVSVIGPSKGIVMCLSWVVGG
jgi:hypothetical protein